MQYWDDETPLNSVNIPGTHDTATVRKVLSRGVCAKALQWNYTQTTQDMYLNLTTSSIAPAIIYQ